MQPQHKYHGGSLFRLLQLLCFDLKGHHLFPGFLFVLFSCSVGLCGDCSRVMPSMARDLTTPELTNQAFSASLFVSYFMVCMLRRRKCSFRVGGLQLSHVTQTQTGTSPSLSVEKFTAHSSTLRWLNWNETTKLDTEDVSFSGQKSALTITRRLGLT